MHPHHKAPPRGPGSDEPNQPPVGLPPNMDAEIQRHMRVLIHRSSLIVPMHVYPCQVQWSLLV